jgi:hypothetical protein
LYHADLVQLNGEENEGIRTKYHPRAISLKFLFCAEALAITDHKRVNVAKYEPLL